TFVNHSFVFAGVSSFINTNTGTITDNASNANVSISASSFDNEGTITLGQGDAIQLSVTGNNNNTISLGSGSHLTFDGNLGGSGSFCPHTTLRRWVHQFGRVQCASPLADRLFCA